MNDRENKSDKVAHDSMELAAKHRATTPSWEIASHCKRPPLKKPPTLVERILALLGVK